MRLYRYRPLETALKEIENETIYFADTEEFNDPITEGFLSLYFKGDEPAWEGLMGSYVCSLYRALSLYLLQGNANDIEKSSLMMDFGMYNDVPLGDLLEELRCQFLIHSEIMRFVRAVGKNNKIISEEEMLHYLMPVNRIALAFCLKSMAKNKMLPVNETVIKDFIEKGECATITLLSHIDDEIDIEEKEIVLGIGTNWLNEIIETSVAKADEENVREGNWLRVAITYPKIYIEQLRNIVHPKGYVACFSENGNDSSMWGTYADNHSGVCMVYDIADSKHVNMKRTDDSTIFLSTSKIEYGKPSCKINLFEGLGRLNFKALEAFFINKSGERSLYLGKYRDKSWRTWYLDLFWARYCRKTADWQHENEHRMLLWSAFSSFDDREERFLTYDFKMLKGVVLGVNMDAIKKINIVRLLREKCKQHKIDDFEIWQAVFNPNTGRMEKTLRHV